MIGGFTAPRGSRTDLGALLVGVYDGDGALRYAGKVGTGFNRATLRDLGASAARRCAATTRRSPTRRASATRPGSSRSSSARSASPSGPAPAACATRASSACAFDKPRRRRSSARRDRPRRPGRHRLRALRSSSTASCCARSATRARRHRRRAPTRARALPRPARAGGDRLRATQSDIPQRPLRRSASTTSRSRSTHARSSPRAPSMAALGRMPRTRGRGRRHASRLARAGLTHAAVPRPRHASIDARSVDCTAVRPDGRARAERASASRERQATSMCVRRRARSPKSVQRLWPWPCAVGLALAMYRRVRRPRLTGPCGVTYDGPRSAAARRLRQRAPWSR